jgi:prephenate dehydratase
MIGYLGPEWSYTFFAASTFYVAEELIPYNNIGRLFYALEHEEVKGIVVPFENMKEGTSFDILGRVRKTHYHISREIVLEIVLSIVSKESSIDDIDQIFATGHSINESYNTLKKELGKYQRFEVKTDKKALEKLNEESKITRGAVLSNHLELGAYNVVVSNIRDTLENTHKYVLITKSLDVNGFHNRTLIACSPKENKVGSLYDILHEFVLRGVSIDKILSNPVRKKDDDIIFYIDLEGNIEDKLIIEAMEIIKFKSKFVSILGSYFSK